MALMPAPTASSATPGAAAAAGCRFGHVSDVGRRDAGDFLSDDVRVMVEHRRYRKAVLPEGRIVGNRLSEPAHSDYADPPHGREAEDFPEALMYERNVITT